MATTRQTRLDRGDGLVGHPVPLGVHDMVVESVDHHRSESVETDGEFDGREVDTAPASRSSTVGVKCSPAVGATQPSGRSA